jgi:CxxC motif-containing protein (DUF1111 family)
MSASPDAAATARAGVRAAIAAAALVIVATRADAGDSAVAIQASPAAAEAGLDLALGRSLFAFSWVSAPASTKSADGLGPLYNARSCAACHTVARRAPRDDSGAAIASALIVKFAGPAGGDPVYGAQLQTTGVHGLPAEGRVEIAYEETPVALAGGRIVRLRKPSYRIADLGYGPLDPATRLSPRVPPSLAGVGLLERIDADTILAWAAEEKASGTGIAGRPSRPPACADRPGCVGRFGWKAATTTVDDQDSLAFSLDIGLSTPRRPAPWGDCTPAERGCIEAPHGADAAAGESEVAPQLLALLDAYVRAVPAPPRNGAESAAATRGGAIFAGIGCATCHRPRYTLAAAAGGTQVIAPYTDLLLHDLGDGLRDAEGIAGDWRTAPLWGLGSIDRGPAPKAYLHDGRAGSLEEAILWHGGEAAPTIAAAKALTAADWDALLAFLRSL